jgi:hypothetical protein
MDPSGDQTGCEAPVEMVVSCFGSLSPDVNIQI